MIQESASTHYCYLFSIFSLIFLRFRSQLLSCLRSSVLFVWVQEEEVNVFPVLKGVGGHVSQTLNQLLLIVAPVDTAGTAANIM